MKILKSKLRTETFEGKKTFKLGEKLSADDFFVDDKGQIVINEEEISKLLKSPSNTAQKAGTEVTVSVKIKF